MNTKQRRALWRDLFVRVLTSSERQFYKATDAADHASTFAWAAVAKVEAAEKEFDVQERVELEGQRADARRTA